MGLAVEVEMAARVHSADMAVLVVDEQTDPRMGRAVEGQRTMVGLAAVVVAVAVNGILPESRLKVRNRSIAVAWIAHVEDTSFAWYLLDWRMKQ